MKYSILLCTLILISFAAWGSKKKLSDETNSYQKANAIPSYVERSGSRASNNNRPVKEETITAKDPLNGILPTIQNVKISNSSGSTTISYSFDIYKVIDDNTALVYPVTERHDQIKGSLGKWVSANRRIIQNPSNRTYKSRGNVILLKGIDFSEKADNESVGLKNDQILWKTGLYKRGSVRYRIYTADINEARKYITDKKLSGGKK